MSKDSTLDVLVDGSIGNRLEFAYNRKRINKTVQWSVKFENRSFTMFRLSAGSGQLEIFDLQNPGWSSKFRIYNGLAHPNSEHAFNYRRNENENYDENKDIKNQNASNPDESSKMHSDGTDRKRDIFFGNGVGTANSESTNPVTQTIEVDAGEKMSEIGKNNDRNQKSQMNLLAILRTGVDMVDSTGYPVEPTPAVIISRGSKASARTISPENEKNDSELLLSKIKFYSKYLESRLSVSTKEIDESVPIVSIPETVTYVAGHPFHGADSIPLPGADSIPIPGAGAAAVAPTHRSFSVFLSKNDKSSKLVKFFHSTNEERYQDWQDNGVSPTVIAVLTSLGAAIFFVVACILGFVLTEIVCSPKSGRIQRAKISPCVDLSSSGYLQ